MNICFSKLERTNKIAFWKPKPNAQSIIDGPEQVSSQIAASLISMSVPKTSHTAL